MKNGVGSVVGSGSGSISQRYGYGDQIRIRTKTSWIPTLPLRKDDIKQICARWYIKYFMARVIWRQKPGSKWSESNTSRIRPFDSRVNMAGWIFEMKFFYSLRVIDIWNQIPSEVKKNGSMWEVPEGLQSAESKPVAPRPRLLMGSSRAKQTYASKVQPETDVLWEALPEPWGMTSQVDK